MLAKLAARWTQRTPMFVQRASALGAYVVGSQATRFAQGKLPDPKKDWDLFVPYSAWRMAAMLVPRTATLNGNRGFRFKDGEAQIDVWPDELARFLSEATNQNQPSARPGSQFAVSLKTGLVIEARIESIS